MFRTPSYTTTTTQRAVLRWNIHLQKGRDLSINHPNWGRVYSVQRDETGVKVQGNGSQWSLDLLHGPVVRLAVRRLAGFRPLVLAEGVGGAAAWTVGWIRWTHGPFEQTIKRVRRTGRTWC